MNTIVLIYIIKQIYYFCKISDSGKVWYSSTTALIRGNLVWENIVYNSRFLFVSD